MLVGARNQPIRMRAKSARSKGNYAQALEICEEAFTHNPWDVSTAREASETAEAAGYLPLAEWYMESVQAQAKDAEFFRHAAHVFEINEHWPKAIACWEQVKKLNPNDENANRQINSLSASATIKRAGLTEALGKKAADGCRRFGRGDGGQARAAQARSAPPRGEMAEGDPGEPEPDLALPEPGGALPQPQPARGRREDPGPRDQGESQGSDAPAGLRRGPDQPHEACHRVVLAAAQGAAGRRRRPRPSSTRSPSCSPTTRSRNIAAGSPPAPRTPTSITSSASALARAGLHDEAIAEFQQARSSQTHKVQALFQMGLSFEANNALKLAERSYRDALKAVEPEDVSNLNALNYRLGRVAEAHGNMRGRRGALQRGRGQRLHLSRRGPAAS